MRFYEDIDVRANVRFFARERGKLIWHYESHNVITHIGGEWLRDLMTVNSYPVFPAGTDGKAEGTSFSSAANDFFAQGVKAGDVLQVKAGALKGLYDVTLVTAGDAGAVPPLFSKLTVSPAFSANDTTGTISFTVHREKLKLSTEARIAYRPMYMVFGVGGVLQGKTPPGAGSQTESPDVKGMETPVQTAENVWLGRIIPQDNLEDPETYPLLISKREVRFRRVFDYDDVSFPAQPTFGVAVPVSEIGLLTSEANAAKKPTSATFGGGNVPGFVAYNIFSEFTKTPKVTLEVQWSLKF